MKKRMKYDKGMDKEVVLCETTNRPASKNATRLLMQDAIPFSTRWKRVPFLKREAYKGASEVCIIRINRNEYAKARRSIERLDEHYRNRLLLNII